MPHFHDVKGDINAGIGDNIVRGRIKKQKSNQTNLLAKISQVAMFIAVSYLLVFNQIVGYSNGGIVRWRAER